MNVIILAGGLGTRLSEYTESLPKPMVPVGGRPMLWHVMNTYARYERGTASPTIAQLTKLLVATGHRPPVLMPSGTDK